MEKNEIRYTLDLLVRLIDTTTGMVVTERDVHFRRNGKKVQPVQRGNGNYVFLNTGREDCDLEVTVFDFETAHAKIRYEKLDNFLPIKDVFLIPSENTAKGEAVLSLTGHLSGLEAIEAVRLGRSYCTVKNFDARKRIMNLFKANGPGMEETGYGLIHADSMTFEAFNVEKVVSPVSLKLRETLQEEFRENAPIARVVHGRTDAQGNYLLRIRDDGTNLKYLVRYVVSGSPQFQVVDFHQPEIQLK